MSMFWWPIASLMRLTGVQLGWFVAALLLKWSVAVFFSWCTAAFLGWPLLVSDWRWPVAALLWTQVVITA